MNILPINPRQMAEPADSNSPLLQDQLLDVTDLFRAIGRHKWSIVSIALIVVVLAGLGMFATPPLYQATTTLLIENHSNRPVQQVPDVYDPGYGTFEYIGTQYKILQARELARTVVKKLGLADKPEFNKNDSILSMDFDWQWLLPFLPDVFYHPRPAIDPQTQKLEHAVDIFQKHLLIEPIYGSNLVKVHFDSRDPDLAAQVANAMSGAFIENNLEARLAITRKTTDWLNDRLGNIRTDLNNAEAALQTFRDKEQLVNVGGARGLVEQQLTDNAQRLRDAQSKKAALASAYWKVQQAGTDYTQLDNISELLTSPVVAAAKNRMLEEQQQVRTLESRYGPRHPKMEAARASLAAATAAYHAQLLTAAQGVKANYEVSAETERQLGSIEQGAKSQIRGLDRKQAQLDALQRDVDTNRELYNQFLTRFKETETAGNQDEVVARVVDPAVVPDKPYKPDKKKIMLWAICGGLILGLLSAILRHVLSDTISSSEDMEALTRLQVLSALPLYKRSTKEQLQAISDPKGGFSEGIRSVRTGLLLSDLDTKRKRIAVTSAGPEEGKTTIACNLAIALGQMERVLLVDCDLRRGTVSRVLGFENKPKGLTEYFAGSAPLTDCIHRYEEGHIDVLPVGHIPPNPGEILASQKFRQMAAELADQYDRVVFDTAPCQAVSDTLLLAQNLDAMIFVTKAETTTRSLIKHAARQLRYAHAPLIGTVINAVDMERYAKRYGGYYYGYRYYA